MNINDKVKVQLTAFGADLWNKQYDNLKIPVEYLPAKVATLDYIETQLWDLMAVFGPHIGLGRDVPFVACQMEIM